MKKLAFFLAVALTAVACADEPAGYSLDTPKGKFVHTTSCSIILHATVKQIHQTGISMDRFDPGVPIADFIDVQLAANSFTDASGKYYDELQATGGEYTGVPYKTMVGAVLEGINQMSKKEKGAMGRNCIDAYLISVDRYESG